MNPDTAIVLFLPDPESPIFSGGVHGCVWIGISPLKSLDSSMHQMQIDYFSIGGILDEPLLYGYSNDFPINFY